MRQSCLKMLVRLCPRAPVVNSSDLLAAIFFSLFFGPTQAQPPTSSSVAELPGPSPALHAAAFHTCVRNFYAATNGNDRNPGTLAQPWLTIQHADTSSRTGGDCINVAPGLYQASVLIRHGGTSPTSTGYVVYRCAVMNACHVQQPRNGGNTLWGITKSGSFVVIDGFELDGNTSTFGGITGACVRTDDPTLGSGNSAHHVWVLNNIIHDCNMSGVQLNNKEWFYVAHNKVHNNSFTSGYQGSGISIASPRCIEAGNASCWQASTYTPSGMDLNTYSPFHFVVGWNDVSGNRIDASKWGRLRQSYRWQRYHHGYVL